MSGSGRRSSLRTWPAEGGFATLAHVAGAALALYLFAVLVNLVAFQYAAGVVRSALDEGTRAGSVIDGGAAVCRERADQVLDGLLGGSFGDRVEVSCTDGGGWVRAQATVELPGLVPPVPTVRWRFDASAVREPA